MESENSVSIIVPVYNVQKYIEESIQSVKMQECREYECIIVDDGSDDDSLKIIEKLIQGDGRFKLYHQENMGVSEARNTAISHAAGDYLMFLDGDDILRPDAVSIVKKDIQYGQPDVVLYPMMSYYEKKQADGSIQKEVKPREWNMTSECCSGSEALADCIYKDNFMFAVWQTAVNRQYLQKRACEFKTGIVHEDELWLMRVIGNASKVKMGSKAYYMNRGGREGGITQSHNIQKEYDKCTVIDELQKDLISNQVKDKKLNVLIQEKCAELELSLILKYREYAREDKDKKLLNGIRQKRKIMWVNSNRKYKMVWMLSCIIGVKAASKLLGLIYGR